MNAIDLALVTIEMPRLSGIEVIRALRSARAPVADIPVLALTGHLLRANGEAILAAGADTILIKPVTDAAIFDSALAETFAAAGPRPQALPEGDGADPALDRVRFEQVLALAGPESEGEFLGRLESDLRKVARELETAVPDRDLNALLSETHALISLAGAVGAAALAPAVAPSTIYRKLEHWRRDAGGGGVSDGGG